MSRIGKIARISQWRREELNRRIEDGEPGRPLVDWLNSLDDVQETLELHFNARPITEQNLSEWKQGGFKDWQRHQETRALARDFLAEAEELEDEVGEHPLTDRLTETVALSLAGLLREALQEEKGPRRRTAILEIARELARLRSGDHHMEILRREEEERETAERNAREAEMRESLNKIRLWGNLWRKEYCDGLKAGTLDPERAAIIREYFFKHDEVLREAGVEDLPPDSLPTPVPSVPSVSQKLEAESK